MKKKRGFTLIELLAVIVVLAVILIIAVPKISEIIDNSKLGTITSSAKVILDAAEKKKTENQVLENVEELTCNKVTNLNDTDYQSCELTFNNNIPYIVLIGKGKLKGYKCEGAKDNLNCRKVVNTNLIIDFDGGDTSGDVSGTYAINTKVTLPSPTKPGYDFNGWQVISGNGVLSGNVITIGNQDTKVKATYKSKKYVVTLNANGGEISSNVLTVSYGAPYENLPTPTRQYYNFLGWYTDSEGGELVNNTSLVSIAANHVLYARWESSLLNVTYEYLINNYSCGGTTKGTPVFTYTGTCEILDDSSVLAGAWRIKFKSSGNLTFVKAAKIDAFLVGAGGGGDNGSASFGGNGGGGGYTVTAKNNIIEANTAYSIVIGAGGAYGGGQAPSSSAFGYVAKGGYSNGTGGSGGGKGGYNSDGKAGASYGASSSSGLSGQGKTTCEFEEGTTSGCTRGTAFAYASGGGGGGTSGGAGGLYAGSGGRQNGDTCTTGYAGTANTGSGGGGGGAGEYTNVNIYYTNNHGSPGGSGVVVIRNAR